MVRYVRGDATALAGDGSMIIVHVCDEAGFVLALSQRWQHHRSHVVSCPSPGGHVRPLGHTIERNPRGVVCKWIC